MTRNGSRGSLARALSVVGAVLASGACDTLLDVELPGSLTEQDLLTPSLAETLVLSAVADYECAYAEFAASVAGLEDVFWESTGWFTRAWAEYTVSSQNGALDTTPCGEIDTTSGFFTSFQSARFQAEQAHAQISDFDAAEVPNREKLLAQAATYAGYVYQAFGEHWCEVAVDLGPLMTPDQTLQRGEEWFDQALTHIQASGDFSTATTSSMRQLALLGRARVRFALGDLQGAAADAEQIPITFQASITRDAGVRKRWNQVYQHHTVNKYSTVAGPVEWQGQVVSQGYRNLTIAPNGDQTVDDGVPDPRVPVVNTGGLGQDGVTPHWIQTKYNSHGDDMPMARWAEAQLILAEIEGGQQAVDRINALRDVHSLPHVSSVDQETLIEERRREFFYEGRFHADKLRYDLWFPRAQGFNHKNIAYGPATCLPLSEQERILNPNIS
ncbi:MAG: RagB/SusD family nutrient uptake outer membrane protein [Gemmatimonadetes bacterium]|nr:RagB/SusD family nutrient uptake outer membrane protein [Gemmatimonadota bacterium]